MSTCDHHYWSLKGHKFPFDLFVTKNRRSKAGRRKLTIATFLLEWSKTFYDQNIPTVAFWSLATSPGHVGIQRGDLTWHKIQPGPIRCFTWAEPINLAYLCFFHGQLNGPSQFLRPFSFLAPFLFLVNFYFC